MENKPPFKAAQRDSQVITQVPTPSPAQTNIDQRQANIAQVFTSDNNTQPTQAIPRSQPVKKQSHIFKIFLGVAIVLLVVASYLLISSLLEIQEIKDASKTSSMFLTYLANDQPTPAYNLTSIYFQQHITKIKLSSYAQEISQLLKIQTDAPNLNISLQIGPFKSLTNVYITYSANDSGKEGPIMVTLKKQNDRWLVDGFSISVP